MIQRIGCDEKETFLKKIVANNWRKVDTIYILLIFY